MKLKQKYCLFKIQVLVVLIFVSISFNISGQTYGLKFNAQDVTLDKRTELDLTPDRLMKFNTEFEISFDFKTTRIAPNSNIGFFGYVFRIINQDGNNIDLLSTPTPDIGLNVVIGKSNSIIPVSYPLNYINNWIRLRIKFILAEDRLVFYTPDTFYVQENVGFKKHESYKIIFGANDYKQFKSSDVPSMAIKDIEIYGKGKLRYKWPLDEKQGNVAIDRIKGEKAKVINPSWLIVNHQNWKQNIKEEFDEHVVVTSDVENGNIYMVGAENLYIYSAINNEIRQVQYKKKADFFNWNYRIVFNENDKKIYCYLTENNALYALNPEDGEWQHINPTTFPETSYRHHNSYFDPTEDYIYLLGGYGLHRYKNKITRIDITSNAWEDLPTNDTIYPPRYLAGLGSLNDTLYILGGYGSQTGNQLINPHSYFDMLGYSLKDGKLFKKFEIPDMIDDMIVGNSMWVDEVSRDYYALIFGKIKFENELQLIRGNLDNPEVVKVGNKIPFTFLDIRSVANLYYMPIPNKLYAYTSYATDSTTQVAIYSIDNPPNESLVFDKLKSVKSVYWYLMGAGIIVVGLGVLILVRKRKKQTATAGQTEVSQKEYTEDQEYLTSETIEALPKYQIIYFGGFQIFNNKFEDITQKFSPLLKELFLLIVLNTFKNNKGISADKIIETLWYDKPVKSARNNRAVNIAKLRTILEEIGPCELSQKTGYWKINFKESGIKSDYIDFLKITTSKKNLTKQNVNKLIEITSKGAFLLNVHYDWLDDFKADVSDKIVDTLVQYAKICDVKADADFVIHIADCIFNFDVINEDAMILKCKAQYCLGKHSHSKATYEKFFKEYMAMYGQEYDHAFLDILEIKE